MESSVVPAPAGDENIAKKRKDQFHQLKLELEEAYKRNVTVSVGYISNLPESSTTFTFATGTGTKQSISIDLFNVNLSTLKQLPWKPSPVGFELRLSFKVGQPQEVQASSILAHLGQMVLNSRKRNKRTDDGEMCEDYSDYETVETYHVEINKMIMLEQGDMLTKQMDTPETDLDMSLVVYLPTECTGGSLMFDRFDSAVSFKPKHINYIIFQPNMPHAVTPVESGYRLCVTYKVYKLNAVKCHHEYGLVGVNWPFEKGFFSTPRAPKNILISCPNVRKLEAFLQKCDKKLKYEVVFAPSKRPSMVYIPSEDDTTDIIEWPNISVPGDLCTNYAWRYKVERSINIGYQEHSVMSSSLQFCSVRGESPCNVTREVCKVFQFLLLNPCEETD